jgi:hypothetical protein
MRCNACNYEKFEPELWSKHGTFIYIGGSRPSKAESTRRFKFKCAKCNWVTWRIPREAADRTCSRCVARKGDEKIGTQVGVFTLIERTGNKNRPWVTECENGHRSERTMASAKKFKCRDCKRADFIYKMGQVFGDRKIVKFGPGLEADFICSRGHRSHTKIKAASKNRCLQCVNEDKRKK